MDCFTDLRRRGLVFATTGDDEVAALLRAGPVTAYAGFDPTADSLHIGNLVPLFGLARLQRYGHRPIVLAGAATGMVGDPSGKSEERNLLDADTMERNLGRCEAQLRAFLDFESRSNGAILVNNHDWLGRFSYLGFLRDVGKLFSISYMLAKDSVKGRLDRESGISYTEFSYMLLQAYDFLHLYRTYGCNMQVGGSDQLGNITAGCELIRKATQGRGYGLAFPLICTASGAKFGKTEKGNVWLDAEKTSPYELYQYFVRTEDADVVRYLSTFTFLSCEEIDELAELAKTRPEQREAQKRLAWEMTVTVHGKEAARSAVAGTELLYGGSADAVAEKDLLAVAADIPRTTLPGPFGGERDVVDLLVAAGLVKSRGEGKRLVKQGGAYINNVRAADGELVGPDRLLFGRYLLLRAGKRSYHLLEITGS